MSASTAFSRAILLSLGLGCTVRPLSGDDSATGATTGGGETTGAIAPTTTTTGPSTTSTATTLPLTTTEPATSEPMTAGCSFLDCTGRPDLPPDTNDCDGSIQPMQDCPAGQKCTYEGDLVNSHCVDVVPDPKGLYEPCQLLDGQDFGTDDCGPALVCWNIDADTGVGTCVGLCGWAADYVCADLGATCVYCQDCAMGLCLPGCDPLAQDCNGGDLCIPDAFGDKFICVLDASPDTGQAFDPCEFVNTCDPGLMCADPAFAKECDPMAAGCCLPFCDLTMPTCPGDGLTCVPWFEPGMAPPALENVGLCRLPP